MSFSLQGKRYDQTDVVVVVRMVMVVGAKHFLGDVHIAIDRAYAKAVLTRTRDAWDSS